jgi:hypothetical protein
VQNEKTRLIYQRLVFASCLRTERKKLFNMAHLIKHVTNSLLLKSQYIDVISSILVKSYRLFRTWQ